MLEVRFLSWWYWLVTVALVTAGVAGWTPGLLYAIGVTAFQLVPFLTLGRRLDSFKVQVRLAYCIQWTAVNWDPAAADNPQVRETSSLGAAGLSNGKIIAIDSFESLDTGAGTIQGQAALLFSYEDGILVEYSGAAGFDPLSFTAFFGGPMNVVYGWGRFAGAKGSLTIVSKILFGPQVGTFEIKGVIKTAN